MKRFPSLAWLALLLPCAALAETASSPPIVAVDRSYMNLKASPCEDFYTYANGAFDSVPIPGEYASYGVNQEIDERNFAILKEILETSASTSAKPGTVTQRVGDFYAAGMDEAAIEKAGVAPLQPWLDEIAAVQTPRQLVATIAHLQHAGVEVGFGFGVQVDDKNSAAMIAGFTQGGLGLPERDYYSRRDGPSEDIRKAYVAHIARTLELGGATKEDARNSAAAIMGLETRLADASRTLVERRDPEKNYNKYERVALTKLSPNLDWEGFFTAIRFPRAEKTVLVGQPEFFTALSGLIASEPISTWRMYLRWHLLSAASNFLGRAWVDEHFAFYRHTLAGVTEQRPRWKRVLAAADHAIGEDLGQLYVRRAFSPAAKERALKMVKFHLEAMRERIRTADWMTEASKVEAYRKLDTMRSKVGYPDVWRDYGKLKISRQPYVLNVFAAEAFESDRQLAKLGRPVDRNEWLMTPQTNNAYYEPTLNEMCFPAGILQPPFFDEKADDASNYGALASTIGHELTHGFDDQGSQYDASGNLHNWWTKEDRQHFEARAEKVAQQYDGYEVLPGLHINGHQTLGENIADIGGLRVSYDAFRLATKNQRLAAIDGFTPDQRFFIAFAQGWRTNQRPEQVRLQATSDVHSPIRWRVLGPVANFPEFRAAFGCPEPAHPEPAIW